MGKNGGEAFQHTGAQACHNEDLLYPANQVITRSNQNNEFAGWVQQVFLFSESISHSSLLHSRVQETWDPVFASPDLA